MESMVETDYTGKLSDIILTKTSSILSILGSTYVIQDVLRSPKKRKESVYHPIMLGLSCMDILLSMMHFLQSWPQPSDGWPNDYAKGTVATCDTVGFIGTVGNIGTPLYTCSLATYFMLELKCNWTKSRIEQFQKWMHIVPWTSGLIVAFAALASSALGPFDNLCWITKGYPNDCEEPDSGMECIRGDHNAHDYFWPISILNFIACLLYVPIVMHITYRHVLDIEKKAEIYSFARFTSFMNERKNRERSKRILLQGVLYSVALIITYFFPIVYFLTYLMRLKAARSVLFTLMSIFYPLQGFLNAGIYKLPQLLKWWQNRKRRVLRESLNSESSSTIKAAALESLQKSIKDRKCLFNPGDHDDDDDNAKLDLEEFLPETEMDKDNVGLQMQSVTGSNGRLSIDSSTYNMITNHEDLKDTNGETRMDRSSLFPVALESSFSSTLAENEKNLIFPNNSDEYDIGESSDFNGKSLEYKSSQTNDEDPTSLISTMRNLNSSILLADLEVSTQDFGYNAESSRSIKSMVESNLSSSFQLKCAATAVAASVTFKDATCNEIIEYVVKEDVESVSSHEDYFLS